MRSQVEGLDPEALGVDVLPQSDGRSEPLELEGGPPPSGLGSEAECRRSELAFVPFDRRGDEGPTMDGEIELVG